MLKTKGESLQGKTAVVSGSGNVAQYKVQKLNELGAKVVTMSDSAGFIYDPAGIDDEKLAFVMELKNIRRGRIHEYAENFATEYFEGKRPWSVKCDAAFPSATENEVNQEDAKIMIQNGCRLVSEGANMPSTPGAIEVYLREKILYGPGKAANAGGVAVSGLEMTQNSMRLPWSREEVDTRLHSIMQNIHKTCVKFGSENGGYVNYLKGANIGGFVKVADAMMAQGIV
jgi:glutamate dehydrogenase (NADP+)